MQKWPGLDTAETAGDPSRSIFLNKAQGKQWAARCTPFLTLTREGRTSLLGEVALPDAWGRRQAGNSSSPRHPWQQGGIVRGLIFNPVMRKKRNIRKRFPPSRWLARSLRLSGRLRSDGSRREYVFPAAWEGMADVGNHCYAFLRLGELLYATIRGSLRLLDRKPGRCVLRCSQTDGDCDGKKTLPGSSSFQSLAGVHAHPWSPGGDTKGRDAGSTVCSKMMPEALPTSAWGTASLKHRWMGVVPPNSVPLHASSCVECRQK